MQGGPRGVLCASRDTDELVVSGINATAVDPACGELCRTASVTYTLRSVGREHAGQWTGRVVLLSFEVSKKSEKARLPT